MRYWCEIIVTIFVGYKLWLYQKFKMAAAAILNYIGSSNASHLCCRMMSYVSVLNLIEILH